MNVTSKNRLGAYVLGVLLCAALVTPTEALAQKKKAKDYAAFAFDADKRKKTRRPLGARLTYSGSIGVSHLSETGRVLDDAEARRASTNKVSLSFATRLKITERLTGFAHLDFSAKKKSYGEVSYPGQTRLRVKEAHLSYALSPTYRLSLGRMRFSDPRRRAMDAAGDGVHLGYKTPSWGWEAALFKDAFGDRGVYALAHAQRYERHKVQGLYGLIETLEDEARIYVSGYAQSKVKGAPQFDLGITGVFGDAANGKSSGWSADATITKAFTFQNLNPHLSLGLAFGTEGYVEPRLASHKAKEGGQAQFKRFGTVFQPELTNLAVASVAVGLRPSRKFSLDLRAHAYAQLNASTVAPVARVTGRTTGLSRHVGHEVSLVGAWRAGKSSKIEFGAGLFKPGKAYENRRSSSRLFVRFTQYF